MRTLVEFADMKEITKLQTLPAGDFSSWLHHVHSGQAQVLGMDVPCGECRACCTSSYFIHIRPDELQTLAHIPKALLFPAPGLPKGNVLMGYDEQGHCPMLADSKCSIYEQRPLICRNYDCRVFSAAGIPAGEDDKSLISQQARRWKFTYPDKCDREEHAAVRAAAGFLHDYASCFPAGFIPANPTQLAALAIEVYHIFLGFDGEAVAASMVEGIIKMVMEAVENHNPAEGSALDGYGT